MNPKRSFSPLAFALLLSFLTYGFLAMAPFALFANSREVMGTSSEIDKLLASRDQLNLKEQASLQKRQQDRTEYLQKRSAIVLERDQKIGELEAEKKQSRKELAAGLYCSKCSRSKSKVEREEKTTFEKHLKKVRGRAIPMSAGGIAKEMAKYNKQIERLRQSYQKKLMRLDQAEDSQRLSAERKSLDFTFKIEELEARLADVRQSFQSALGDYPKENKKADALWYGKWQQDRAFAQAKMDMVELRNRGRREGLEQRLQQALAANQETRSIREQLTRARQQEQKEISSWREKLNELARKFEAERFERERERRDEEQLVSTEANRHGFSYFPSGVSYDYHGQARHQQAAQSQWGGAIDSQAWHAALNGADPQADSPAYGGNSSLVQAKQNLKDLLQKEESKLDQGLSVLRDFIDRIPSVLKESSGTSFLQDGLKGLEAKALGEAFNIGLAADWAQYGLVKLLEHEVDQVSNSAMERYENMFGVRLIDPDIGVAAWYNPFKPKAVSGFLNEVFEPIFDEYDK